jgi:hypothetical protein
MSELRDRMEADLRLRNLRPATQTAYLTTAKAKAKAKALAARHRRSPAFLCADDVRALPGHLQSDRQTTASTLCVYLVALRFLFCVTLGRCLGSSDHGVVRFASGRSVARAGAEQYGGEPSVAGDQVTEVPGIGDAVWSWPARERGLRSAGGGHRQPAEIEQCAGWEGQQGSPCDVGV